LEPDKLIRKPRQSRSIRTKEKILDAAYSLFCQKGYYNTTTNEIARTANVSIGSLYAYFSDKDTILLEILDKYNESFTQVNDDLNLGMDQYRKDPKMWFRRFIEGMVEAHKYSKEFNQELLVLSHSISAVADILEKQRDKTLKRALTYLVMYKNMLRVQDLEAAAIVATNIIGSTVDQIVFSENRIEDTRIIDAGVDAIFQFLIG
jgi:AcrR family transcriptional regulator